jgi:hypothetical protein
MVPLKSRFGTMAGQNRFDLLRWMAVVTGCIVFSAQGFAEPNASGPYKGFRIDYSQVANNPNLDQIKARMNRQIDMVVEVGLPQEVLSFFRNVPTHVIAGKHAFGGHYVPAQRKIEIPAPSLLNSRKPIYLHELLHAFHHQRLPNSFKNSEIIAYYHKARELKCYDAHSHMMDNEREYFATAGTAYLFGVTELEPFTRDKVRRNQPFLFKHLQKMFGPNAGAYDGSSNENWAKPGRGNEPETEVEGEED